MTEQEIIKLEEEFPNGAAECFREACQKALEAGQSVLLTEDDELYEYFPNGTRKFIKNIIPATKVGLRQFNIR